MSLPTPIPTSARGRAALKFGVPRDQFAEALQIIDQVPRLRLGCIAMHLGSQLLQSEPYASGTKQLLE